MTEIIEHIFLFCAAIFGCTLLFIVAIIVFLLILSFIFFLFSEYPIKTNFIIVILLLILGVPILYIPVLYLVTIALIYIIIGLFVWIFPFDESKNVVNEPESLSKEEVNIKNKTTIEAEAHTNSIFIEDFNNISHSINYTSHPEFFLPSPSLPFNSNYNQYQETIDSEAFKENNLSLISDSGNYEDDDLCLKQEYIITSSVTKILEPSRLVVLEIDIPDLIILKPSQERVFTVHGIDQFGKYIDPGQIFWRATGGKIDSQGRLIVENDAKGSFRVTAISSNARIFQYRSRQNLLLIKISLKIFSWVLSHKKFAKDTISYFIQNFYDSEVLVNEIFPEIDTSSMDILLTVLVFDDIKDWVIEVIVSTIFSYLDKFIALCFVQEHSPLICSVHYIVLPDLQKLIIHPSDINIKPGESVDLQLIGVDQKGDKIEIKRKVTWKATGGSINSNGKLTVNSNSQGIFSVTATVATLSTSINYSILLESRDISRSPSSTNISSINEKIKIHEHHQARYRPDSQKVNAERRKRSFAYTEREKEKRERAERKLFFSSPSWFCNSQLFYDGYSLQDGFSYEEYLEYMDLIDHDSYYK